MIDWAASASAVQLLFSSWPILAIIIPGLIIGLVAGAVPGVNIPMAMALALPLTLYMDFLPAMLFLTAIFTGGSFGGSVPAILMNIPGATSAVATTFDGYPMARKGQHNEALGIALFASVFGSLLGYIVLFVLIDPLSGWVIRLGPLEMFMIAIWGVTLLGTLRGDYALRGLMAGLFGLMIGTIGMNPAGYVRGTMGMNELLDGIALIPAMMGLFAASQLFNLAVGNYLVENQKARKISFRRVFNGFRECIRYPMTILKGSSIGVLIGAIPGVGASVANLVSYAEARRSAPDPESFGTGNSRGLVAAESANSSSEGGSMTTMLTLGIPGGAATAILFAALAMHNVVGGPRLIADQKDIVYAIIIGNFVQGFALLLIGALFVYLASFIIRVPLRYLVPGVLMLATLGSFAVTGSMTGPVTLLVFAVLGWLLARYHYPVAAMVVGLILGSMVEGEFIRTFQISGGDPSYLLERPVALVIAVLLLLSLVQPLLRKLFSRVRRNPSKNHS